MGSASIRRYCTSICRSWFSERERKKPEGVWKESQMKDFFGRFVRVLLVEDWLTVWTYLVPFREAEIKRKMVSALLRRLRGRARHLAHCARGSTHFRKKAYYTSWSQWLFFVEKQSCASAKNDHYRVLFRLTLFASRFPSIKILNDTFLWNIDAFLTQQHYLWSFWSQQLLLLFFEIMRGK